MSMALSQALSQGEIRNAFGLAGVQARWRMYIHIYIYIYIWDLMGRAPQLQGLCSLLGAYLLERPTSCMHSASDIHPQCDNIYNI